MGTSAIMQWCYYKTSYQSLKTLKCSNIIAQVFTNSSTNYVHSERGVGYIIGVLYSFVYGILLFFVYNVIDETLDIT